MLLENNERIGISIDEAAKMLNVGRNLMLEIAKMDGFPAIRLKRKIIINKNELPQWFANSYGKYTY